MTMTNGIDSAPRDLVLACAGAPMISTAQRRACSVVVRERLLPHRPTDGSSANVPGYDAMPHRSVPFLTGPGQHWERARIAETRTVAAFILSSPGEAMPALYHRSQLQLQWPA